MKHYNFFEEKEILPDDDFFCRNTELRDLWYNRNEDEPITSKELYGIVKGIARAIECADERAKRAQRSGSIYNSDL